MKSKAALGILAALALTACSTTDPYTGQSKISNTTGGAAIGALGGAVGGAIIGAATGTDPRVGALIGAGIGGLGGAAVGSYMDQQEAELRAQLASTGVSVTRNGAQIILNMPSNITFAVNQSAINPAFQQTLVSVAIVLQKYNKTLVDIAGHTDSDGSSEFNNTLSQQRAQSVGSFLGQQGVDTRRLHIIGYGESQPIASNASEAGKAQNRRVEIYISPIVSG
jgi:outer membrane protein OmpA-like peptidoglycan-associated protein